MGELILCHQELAALPYYLETIACNVYSLEELSYCIEQQLYLVDDELMSQELCVWIEKELGAKELSERLLGILRRAGSLTEFVEQILRESGYCSAQSVQHILEELKKMQNLSAFACGKLRADRLLEGRKYMHAVLEYRRLLQLEAECSKEPVLCGNIWHNMGTAFARMFLFHEAADCFLTAYTKNQSGASLSAAMAACRCGGEQDRMDEIAEKYGIGAEEKEQMLRRWNQSVDREPLMAFEQELEQLLAEDAVSLETNEELLALLRAWKKEYNRNSRM